MKATARVLGIGLLLTAVLVGCDKKVQLTFVNTTSNSLDVELTVPTEGVRDVGVAGPMGGKVRYDLKVNKDDLPVTCSWRAGGQGDTFTIDEGTKKELFVYIRANGSIGPVDKNAEIKEHRQIEIKDMPIRQEEVVE